MNITGKEAARRIREHNKIHQRTEPRNSPIITEILEVAAVMFEKIDDGVYKPVIYARPVKIFDDPYTGKMFTTCSACDGKISPKDKFCKHCGATIIKG
jgi:PHP family Zn ribbon phosphoesterase